jgi:hypothetical protein
VFSKGDAGGVSRAVASKGPLRRILTPFIVVAAFLYFLLDLLFGVFLRPINRWLARLRIFEAIRKFIESLGPYATLSLFAVPWVLLEPAKLVGVFLLALGHHTQGTIVIVVGESLKILIVERIFQVGRPKLMMIPAFAWTYNYIIGWLTWLGSWPAWIAVREKFRAMVQWTKSLSARFRL